MNANSLTLTDQERKHLVSRKSPSAVASESGGLSIQVRTAAEAIEVAKIMAEAMEGVPQKFRGKPALCLSVVWTAAAWGFNPFQVVKECYVVNDQVAYMAKIIKAAIDRHAPLNEPLEFVYDGEGQSRSCTCIGRIVTWDGKVVERKVTTPKFSDIPIKNSPLWKNDPDQQLAYYAARSWARLHAPQVISGVYDADELDPRNVGMVTSEPRPSMAARLESAKQTSLPPTIIDGETTASDDQDEAPADEEYFNLFIASLPDVDDLSELADALEAFKKSDTWANAPEDLRTAAQEAHTARARELLAIETDEVPDGGEGQAELIPNETEGETA